MARETLIQFLRGIESNMIPLNDGEPGWATDTHKLYMGQGGIAYEVGGASSPLTTKGDIWSHNGTADDRFPVGPDGYIIVADSSETQGLRYADPSSIGGGGSDPNIISRIWLGM